MEVQNPFVVDLGPEFSSQQDFAKFFFTRITQHPTKSVAFAELDSSTHWHYGEIREWTDRCKQRLREIGVGTNSRLALITSTTCRVLFIHLACAELEVTSVCINGWVAADEIWNQLEEVECTHAVVEAQFVSKVDELRRKALMRGVHRCRVVRTLDEVLGEQKLVKVRGESKAASISNRGVSEDSTESDISSSARHASFGTNGIPSAVGRRLANRTQRPISAIPSTASQPSRPNSPQSAPAAVQRRAISGSVAALTHTSSTETSCSGVVGSGRGHHLMIFFTVASNSLFPKPVGIPAQTLIRNLLQVTHAMYGPAEAGDRVLLPISVHHIFGTLSMYAALLGGASVHSLAKYSGTDLAQAIATHRLTRVHLTTNMAQLLLADTAEEQLGVLSGAALNCVVIGGARFDPSLARLYKEKMPDVISLDNTKPKLCQPRQLGHLLCSGPQLSPICSSSGVLRLPSTRPSATTSQLPIPSVDDKFVRTGDAGYYDEQGRLYLIDRLSDIIRYKGVVVCPSEVEALLRTHPGIVDCAVVGRSATPYATGGGGTGGQQELPAAFIVRGPDHGHLSSAEVRQYVTARMEQLAEFPGGIYFVADIPRSVGGRVYRRHLKQFCDRERLLHGSGEGNSQGEGTSSPETNRRSFSQNSGVAAGSAGSATINGKRFRRQDSIVYIPAPVISRLNGVAVKRAEVQRAVELKKRMTASVIHVKGVGTATIGKGPRNSLAVGKGRAPSSVDLRGSLSQLSLASNQSSRPGVRRPGGR